MRLPALKNLLLVCASVAISLLAAEAGLRLAGISYPEFHRLDETRGWAPRPGVEGWWTTEGGAHVRINRAGFRDRNHETAKPDGVLRIAVLGNSFTEARAIPLDETFWSVAGRRLAACPGLSGVTVEMLNFGVSGYGTAQQLITLRDHVLAYGPDLVLLAFYSGNDVWNNNRVLDNHPDRPYLVITDGRLVLDDSFRDSARLRAKMAWQDVTHGLVNASHVVQLFKQGYYQLKAVVKDQNGGVDWLIPAAADAVYLAPADAPWRDAWAVTEATIRALRDAAVAGGAGLWITTLSNAIQVHPDGVVRARFAAALGARDLAYPDQRIAALARAEGIPVIVLAPALRAHAEAVGSYLHGFDNTLPGYGHWNRAGHAEAGRLIAEAICESGAAISVD